ncbi:MAG: pimeloyl-ACP methyl ester carboxylesterase [Oleiphilaceae bacterium]|jgi:pimeloyl-ACP methyl ester carboxylesterase
MQLQSFTTQTANLNIAGLKNDKLLGDPVVALHGWLDNAASFEPISACLDLKRPFYAIDLPGHGLSEHRPPSSSYHLVENIVDVLLFIDTLPVNQELAQEGNGKVTLIGHSLGGIICCLIAASMPERIEKVILLDSMGPLTDETKNVLPQLRKAVTKAMQIKSKVSVFPTIEHAVKTRMMGLGHVNKMSAEMLVSRGTKEVEGGFSWTTDPKLLKPSFLRFTEAQVEAIFSGILCPVKLIRGESGYFSVYGDLKMRLEYFQDVEQVSVLGGHHFHMDGDVKRTAEYVNAYLSV